MRRSIRSGSIAGNGPFTGRCETLLAGMTGAKKVILTNSCTDALELAALLLELGPGDEVIVPSFTFVSTVNAFVLRGATPVFVDVREDTLNLDETLLDRLVTPRSRAIFPVHYAGVGCDMDTVLSVAERHGLAVVEDAAQGVCARYRGRPLGTFGVLGTYSFHATKNYTCGEGGALLVNRPDLERRAEILREKGTNRREFMLGMVDKYTWVDVGSSFLLSDMLAAFLLPQLEQAETVLRRRQALYNAYMAELAGLQREGKIRLPVIPADCQSNYHLFHVLLPSEEERNRLLGALRQGGVEAVFHYVPLHSSPMGQRFGYRAGDLPVTENVSRRLLRLPLYPGLRWRQHERIISLVKKAL
jgi:dTDP-4-amino-4,6-dideoxygalactose transaminase